MIEGQQRFDGIEVGRGVAALLVVIHHARNIMSEQRFFGTDGLGALSRNFNVGADFFFVLSGFIIAWVHYSDIGCPGKLRNFATKRFLRIYPAYWAVLLPLIALYLLVPGVGRPFQQDPWNILFSAALMPYPSPPVLGVAWTLVHEVFFYALFAAIIVGGVRVLWILPVWCASIVAVHILGGAPFPLSFVFSPFNLLFVMGVCAALVLRTAVVPHPRLVTIAGCVSFASFLLVTPNIQNDVLIGRLAFGLPSVLIVLGVVEWQRSRSFAIQAPWLLLGAASYAVYLIHPVVLSATINVASRWFASAPPALICAAVALIAIGAGVGFHLAVERPVSAFLRAKVRSRGVPVTDLRPS